MRKIKKLLATLLVVLSLTACSAAPAATGTGEGVSGEFKGSAEGFHGEVTVTLTLENSELTSAVIEGPGETPNVGGVAIEDFTKFMNENKTVNVDAMTGATYTSEGIAAAVDAALKEAGLTREDFPVIEKGAGETIEMATTVCIVGAGGSGLALANTLLENGVTDVVMLEKMAYTGGATANAGGVDAGLSKLQEELGMEQDSYEMIYNDIINSGTGHDLELVDIMATNEGRTLDWMIELGLPFNDRYGSDFPEHTVQRFFVCEGGMANGMKIFTEKFEENGGKIVYNTRAEELLQDETGRVVGVKATDTDGNTVIVNADAVVIATGGYGANDEMISEKKSDLSYAVFYGVKSSFGDGHKMGQALGAKMLNMGYAKMYPNGISQPGTNDGKATPMPTLTTVNTTGAIFVNKEGNRFVNETLAFADIKNATCKQTDEIMYLVMDEAGWETWKGMVTTNTSAVGNITEEAMEEYFNSDSTQPTFARGTLEEIATKAGIDVEGLKATVDAWNATVASGTDAEFGRTALTELDTTGTLYLVEQKLRFATTLGGFDITANFEVQTEAEEVIPGLYAIGECVGGPNGTEAIPGSMACWAITSGHVLGEQLGAKLGK